MAKVQKKYEAELLTAPGQQYTEIAALKADGTPVKLSEVIGTADYVLVDFWAAWCPDCRKENPNIVAAWNKYKDANFDVLGVSLDRTKEQWLAAIEKDQLTWTHVSDTHSSCNCSYHNRYTVIQSIKVNH